MGLAFRERDIRVKIKELLEATNSYSVVRLGLLESGDRYEQIGACMIEPYDSNASDDWDSTDEGPLHVDCRIHLVFVARDQDDQIRDERAELLLDVAMNTINGNSFDGKVMPEFSVVTTWKWKKAEPPERTIEAVFGFRYLVDTWTDFNTSE